MIENEPRLYEERQVNAAIALHVKIAEQQLVEGIIKTMKSESLAEQYIQMAQAINRVRQLHKPSPSGNLCCHCENSDGAWMPYPCPTIQALDRAQNDAG